MNGEDYPDGEKIVEQIGMEEPVPKDPRGTIESVLGDAEFMAKDHEFTKLFTKTEQFQDIYESKIASSLIASTNDWKSLHGFIISRI